MSGVTKAKINLKEGIIELEGNEDFVVKQLELFKKELQIPKTPIGGTTSFEKDDSDKKERKKKAGKTIQTIEPIPLLLKGDGQPSLESFYKEKKPKTSMEQLTVFAYYLQKFLSIKEMQKGHVVTCCREVKAKIPANISQMFYNIQQRHGWVDVGKFGETVTITTLGTDLVERDLPRKENATTS